MHTVTGNAADLAKMRRNLKEHEANLKLTTCRYSIHLMHLLVKDLSTPGIKENVGEIAKYSHNNQFVSAFLKAAKGSKLSSNNFHVGILENFPQCDLK